jgi:hypothetical protein
LYVKAVYYRKEGVPSEARASIYTDSLMIEGFGDTQPREVHLIAVDRSRNESEVVTKTITPLEPDIFPIWESLNVIADFGGIHAYWDNPNKKEISIVIMEKDHNDELIPVEIYYTSAAKGDAATYGMDTIPREFHVFVQDRWENQTQTKLFSLTPRYEVMFDKSLFQGYQLPGEEHNSSTPISNIWNDKKGGDIYDSKPGPWPQSVTFDMGVTGSISRVKLYQRTGFYIWKEGNPKKFEIWGATQLDLTGNWDKWTLLMKCESVKPSGLPGLGEFTDEDRFVAEEGENFFNSPTNPAVRYIRVKVLRTWAGGDNYQISEMEFFGDNRQNQ